MTADDKQSVLLELIDSDPQKFISIVDDKHLEMKAKITIYLWMNIIRQLPNSSIIVDASNPEMLLVIILMMLSRISRIITTKVLLPSGTRSIVV